MESSIFFSVHVLVAYLESFAKHYNKVNIFSLSTFRIISLENYSTSVIPPGKKRKKDEWVQKFSQKEQAYTLLKYLRFKANL